LDLFGRKRPFALRCSYRADQKRGRLSSADQKKTATSDSDDLTKLSGCKTARRAERSYSEEAHPEVPSEDALPAQNDRRKKNEYRRQIFGQSESHIGQEGGGGNWKRNWPMAQD